MRTSCANCIFDQGVDSDCFAGRISAFKKKGEYVEQVDGHNEIVDHLCNLKRTIAWSKYATCLSKETMLSVAKEEIKSKFLYLIKHEEGRDLLATVDSLLNQVYMPEKIVILTKKKGFDTDKYSARSELQSIEPEFFSKIQFCYYANENMEKLVVDGVIKSYKNIAFIGFIESGKVLDKHTLLSIEKDRNENVEIFMCYAPDDTDTVILANGLYWTLPYIPSWRFDDALVFTYPDYENRISRASQKKPIYS